MPGRWQCPLSRWYSFQWLLDCWFAGCCAPGLTKFCRCCLGSAYWVFPTSSLLWFRAPPIASLKPVCWSWLSWFCTTASDIYLGISQLEYSTIQNALPAPHRWKWVCKTLDWQLHLLQHISTRSQHFQPRSSVCGTTSPVACWHCFSVTARHAKKNASWKSKKRRVTSHNRPSAQAGELRWFTRLCINRFALRSKAWSSDWSSTRHFHLEYG